MRRRIVLLIVPYGIETRLIKVCQSYGGLLIVPYGIETASPSLHGVRGLAFNRTLWN